MLGMPPVTCTKSIIEAAGEHTKDQQEPLRELQELRQEVHILQNIKDLRAKLADAEADRDGWKNKACSIEANRNYWHEQYAAAEARAEKLQNLLCLADDIYCEEHGCFPLDVDTPKARRHRAAMEAIRAVTGDNYDKRHACAEVALAQEQPNATR